jgi:hypothetical protein
MEVQKHPHHVSHKKKWTEYLLEFFMLFLAVFLGFMAENFREHQLEHQREKQYMVTMLEDLKSDIPLLDSTVKYWEIVNSSIDTVTNAITLPVANIDYPKIYRHLNAALNYWSFKYNERTISQLKSSGGFRLIRNKMVANAIIAYDQFNNDAIPNIAYQHNQIFENTIALRSKIFAEEVISLIFARYRNIAAPISMNSQIDSLLRKSLIPGEIKNNIVPLFEFKNSLIALKRDYVSNMLWGYEHIRQKMNNLINLIKQEYDLK